MYKDIQACTWKCSNYIVLEIMAEKLLSSFLLIVRVGYNALAKNRQHEKVSIFPLACFVFGLACFGVMMLTLSMPLLDRCRKNRAVEPVSSVVSSYFTCI